MVELSVIVRTLGRPPLRQALESLAAQRCRDFEVVVVDMSDGAAAAAIARVAPHLPAVTTVAVGHPMPRPRALNLGVQHASAPAIAILDDDNVYGPGHVRTLIDGLASTGADLVYTSTRRQLLTPDGVLISEELHGAPFDALRLLGGNFIYATATAFRRAIWETVGGYDPRFPVFEDWEYLIRVSRAGRIVAIPGDEAISRNFTGVHGTSAHNAETIACARAQAGIWWTHRWSAPATLELKRHLPGWWWESIMTRR